MMTCVFQASGLVKRFNGKTVLDGIDLELKGPAIIGLLGRNGCGKTTLIRHITGHYLPSEGEARTLGVPVAGLGHEQLAGLGFVPQEVSLLEWMTVEQHLEFVASFYPRWDTARQEHLLDTLELARDEMVGHLSSGDLQKLAIILAVCHHPGFLVLDEPVSDLDPISRADLLEFLLEILREDGATILVSSHVLRDVERIVDHVVCLDGGVVVADAALDDLKEGYAEWLVQANGACLPGRFDEPWVLRQESDGRQARLAVKTGAQGVEDFGRRHGVEVTVRPLNLEELFPLLVGRRPS